MKKSYYQIKINNTKEKVGVFIFHNFFALSILLAALFCD